MSNLNFAGVGNAVANGVNVKLDGSGSVCVTSSALTHVIVDITGVEVIDTTTAAYLARIAHAGSLLGATVVLTGVNPKVSQTLVKIGADLSGVRVLGTLKDGLRLCGRFEQRPDAD